MIDPIEAEFFKHFHKGWDSKVEALYLAGDIETELIGKVNPPLYEWCIVL
jgi:hypothetical protein